MIDRLSKNKRNVALIVLAGLMGWFFWTIRSVLNPLILGYLLAFVLHPAVLHLERRRNWSRPRAVNFIFALAALFLAASAAGIYLQSKELVENVVEATDQQDVLRNAERRIDDFLGRTRTWSERWVGSTEDGDGSGDASERGAESLGVDETAPAAEDASDERTEGEAGSDPGEAAGSEGAADEPQGEGVARIGGEPISEDLTLRDLVRAWWQKYAARTEGGPGALALQNAPAVLVVIVNFFGSVVSLVTLLVLLPIYGYFLLFELERIHRFVRRHIPKDERERVTRIGTQIGEVIASFFRGRLLISLLKGAVIAAGLMIAGAPYAFFFGALAGVMSLVPLVGPLIAFTFAFVFALQEMSLVGAAVWVGGTFILGEILEGYVFIPKILGDSLGLHPVVVLVSIFAGGAALGMFGFLIAIPLTAALVILGRELVLPALRQFADEDSHTDPRRPRGALLEPPEPAPAAQPRPPHAPGSPPVHPGA